MRRRTFAASMVVTFSLAEAGCNGGTQANPRPLPGNPPAQPASADAGPADDGAGGDAAADDAAGEDAAGDDAGTPEPIGKVESKEEIVMQPDGTCIKQYSIDCPPGVACNPPPPQPVDCPEGMLPAPRVADNVNLRDDGTCWESFDVDCPKGARCNPPPPRQVECPPNLVK